MFLESVINFDIYQEDKVDFGTDFSLSHLSSFKLIDLFNKIIYGI